MSADETISTSTNLDADIQQKVDSHDVFLAALREMRVRENTVRLSQADQTTFYESTPEYARHGVYTYAWDTGWLSCWRELLEQIVATPPVIENRSPKTLSDAAPAQIPTQAGDAIRWLTADLPSYRSAFLWFNPLSATVIGLGVHAPQRSSCRVSRGGRFK